MKKLMVILMLVAVASPVMAAVTVCSQKSGTTVTVKYSTDGNSVRAFALDMSVSTGTITAVSCTSSSPLGYYIYPGSIQITSGSVQSYGSCICSSTYPGTKAGVNTSAVTVEMGSLYTGTTKPASSGQLLTFTISNSAATVTLAANAARGGVVMERAEETPTVTFASGTGICAPPGVDCYPSTYSRYNDWKSAGKPDCWCGTNTNGMVGTAAWKYQCYGDADNKTQQIGQGYRIFTNDYTKLVSNWQKKITDPAWDRCTDFDHRSQQIGQSYRVFTNDYNRMVSNWLKKDTQLNAEGKNNCPVPNQ